MIITDINILDIYYLKMSLNYEYEINFFHLCTSVFTALVQLYSDGDVFRRSYP